MMEPKFLTVKFSEGDQVNLRVHFTEINRPMVDGKLISGRPYTEVGNQSLSMLFYDEENRFEGTLNITVTRGSHPDPEERHIFFNKLLKMFIPPNVLEIIDNSTQEVIPNGAPH